MLKDLNTIGNYESGKQRKSSLFLIKDTKKITQEIIIKENEIKDQAKLAFLILSGREGILREALGKILKVIYNNSGDDCLEEVFEKYNISIRDKESVLLCKPIIGKYYKLISKKA